MKTSNPFQSPQAHVSDWDSLLDVETPPMQRPATIARAFWLLIASASLDLLNYLATGMHGSALMMAFEIAFYVGFAVLIRAGINWARIAYLILFALGSLAAVYVAAKLARSSPIYVANICLQAALQGYAIWLAFSSPGSQWFGRFRRMPP